MLDILVRDALANIWCSPYQDRQVIIKLAKHTAGSGVRKQMNLQWEIETLPTENDYYHVYGIGRNNPSRLNLDERIGVWYLLSEVCERNDLVAEVYTESGIHYPRYLVYVKRTINRSYIFAIRKSRKLPNLDNEPVYLRLYSNAFYNSTRFDGGDKIKTQGRQLEVKADALPFQWRVHQYRDTSRGAVYAYVNGQYVDDLKPMYVDTRDHVEWFYDASIRETVWFKLDELKTFTSALDQQKKYLLHPPKDLDTIDYFDDCDVYLVNKSDHGYIGRYVHRNNEKTLRQVTHNDYALSVLTVQRFIDTVPGWHDTSNLYVVMHIRNSGYRRALRDEHNRLKELYKLTDNQIERAMVGIDSTLPEWRASNLEAGNYVRIMRSYYEHISANMVINAYGYNALVKALADTPTKVTQGIVLLPPALARESTVYEYDSAGKLLSFHPNVNNDRYIPKSVDCNHVEAIVGIGSLVSGIRMGSRPITLDPDQEYRFYVSAMSTTGVPFDNWVDVTGDTTKYQLNGNQVIWLIDPLGQIGAIKGTRNFVSYSTELTPLQGVMRFSINHQIPGNVLPITPGVLDIWLNGYALIENVDFYVDFPEVCIVNKAYLQSGMQTVTVRAYGFATSDLQRERPTDSGFVLHNTVSLNNTYNIRDDKVIRCVVGGKVVLRDALKFAENQCVVNVPNGLNGLPYAITDIPQALQGLVPFSNYPLRERSQDLDHRVSEYLTERLPETPITDIPTIPDYYPVYSPLMSALLYDIREGILALPRAGASDQEVLEYLSTYRSLLKYEPAINDNRDSRFVIVHAHSETETVTVSREVYAFLERVSRLMLRGNVSLTHSVQIETV